MNGFSIPEKSRIDWRNFDLEQNKMLKNLKKIAKERDGECLSENYLNTNTKLIWRCGICGNIWKATPDNIIHGRWCPTCARKRRGEKEKLTIDEMQSIAKNRNGYCLSKKYVDSRTKLIWKCGICGFIWKATPTCVKGSKNRKGTWCPNFRIHNKILKNDKEKILEKCQKKRRWNQIKKRS